MKKNVFGLFLMVTLLSFQTYGQKTGNPFIVVWYNVENLFDTIHSSDADDTDYTPSGKYNWNSLRYEKKVDDLARVIGSANEENLPALVGMCEIENRNVLEDLIKSKSLIKGKYQIIHENSPDERGIDVAFLYRSEKFTYVSHKAIHVYLDSVDRTRDILYVKGIVMGTDTVHVFLNHWPSRRGGDESELKRVKTAQLLRHQVDSIVALNPNAKIMIMGDLNDEPANKSVLETLMANNIKNDSLYTLYNLMLEKDKLGKGTLSYKGEWNMLDNFIVSFSLIDSKKGLTTNENKAIIYSPEWICYKDKSGNLVPNRTYAGDKYTGGFSDHFPLVVVFDYLK